jgi:hypothetical protein
MTAAFADGQFAAGLNTVCSPAGRPHDPAEHENDAHHASQRRTAQQVNMTAA